MATNSNGQGTVTSNGRTAAQRTQEKHASHQTAPPGALDQTLTHASSSDAQIPDEPTSSKEVAEEDLEEKETSLAGDLKIKKDPVLDTRSNDAFPALGAGPKPQVGNQVATAWDSKKSAPVKNDHSNGVNGSGAVSNASSSRASSPPLSTTPASTNAPGASQPYGSPIARLTLPGWRSEKIQFLPSELRSKDQLKKPLQDIARDISKKSKVEVKFRVAPDGTVSFEAYGPGDSIRKALNDVKTQVAIARPVKGPSQSSTRAPAVGKPGNVLQQIQKQTGAKIDIGKAEESASAGSGNDLVTIDIPIEGNAIGADSSGKINVRVRGTQKQVEDAKKKLEHRAKVFDNSSAEPIQVDKKYHRALIGAGGANIRDIVNNAGGSTDRKDPNFCNVRFPAQISSESAIQIEGNKAVVEKVVAAINSFVERKNGQGSEGSQTIEVAPEKHSVLIGREGTTRRQLEAKFSVRIDIPKKSPEGAARSHHIKLTGLPEDIEKARVEIMARIDQESKTIQVPRRIHHGLTEEENIFIRLRRNHEVTVSHAGASLPPKPAKAKYTPSRGQENLPLITGERHAAENYTWEVSDPCSADQDEGEIPWVLRGPSAGVEKALAAVEKAIQDASNRQQHLTGYLVLPDTGSHRFIVGQRGSQIKAIREQTGCRISIPRDQTEGEAIEIVGSREEIESAKDIILDIVRNRGQRR